MLSRKGLAFSLGTLSVAAAWMCSPYGASIELPPPGPELESGYDAGLAPSDGGDDRDDRDDDAGDPPPPPCNVTKVATDPFHCGVCGHSCFGGTCVDGKCKPIAIVTGLTTPLGLAVAGDHLYVGVPGRVREYLLDGGSGRD